MPLTAFPSGGNDRAKQKLFNPDAYPASTGQRIFQIRHSAGIKIEETHGRELRYRRLAIGESNEGEREKASIGSPLIAATTSSSSSSPSSSFSSLPIGPTLFR
jgi:hypothetical protein